MRMVSLLLLALFLLGCSSQLQKNFVVSLLHASSSPVSVAGNNESVDKVSFILQNDEAFALDCSVLVTLDNRTDSSYLRGSVGLIGPGEGKNVSLSLSMLDGKSSMSIVPDCRIH